MGQEKVALGALEESELIVGTYSVSSSSIVSMKVTVISDRSTTFDKLAMVTTSMV